MGVIEGQVTDAQSGDPLPGVNVVIVGSQQGAATDGQGNYQISAVEVGTYDLQASFVGYSDQVIEDVQVTANQTTEVNFTLQREQAALEEVVVVGYGTQQRRDLTGAVTSVDQADIESVPSTSIDNAIKGRAAGVYVKQTNAAPGGATSVRIRGTNSLNAGSEPLYVIDGFPIFPDNSSESTGGAAPAVNVLSTLNLSNIESIEVLKDASATAIYGSRGASGVVLIETAGGDAGETRVQYSGSQSLETISNGIEMLNAADYARYRNRLIDSQVYSDQQIQQFEQEGGTDWMDEITRTGSIADHSLTVSGGDQNSTYSVTGNFHRNEGILMDTHFQRYGVRLNLSNDLLDDRLQVDNSWSYSRTSNVMALSNQGSPGGIIITGLQLEPTPASPRAEDGSYNYPLYDGRFQINPVAELETGTNERRNNRFFGNTQISFRLAEGLTLRERLGADYVFNNRDTFFPRTTSIGMDARGRMEKAERNIRDLLSETTLSYNADLTENHSIDAVAGYSWQDAVNRFGSSAAEEFPVDDFSSVNLQNGGESLIPSSSRIEWNLQSFFGRLNYNFGDRYLLTFTFRRDGSSKFGANNQWANFPSGAIGWRVNNEPFFQSSGLNEVVSNFKIRASWGRTGNSEIPVYQSISGLGVVNYNFGGQLASGLAPNRIPNPDLQWEETEMRNIGLDLGLLDGRLNVTAEYFNNVTDQLLLNVNIPASNGFNTQLQNTGSLENTGFEFSADYSAITTETLRWNLAGNVTITNNEITSLGETTPFWAGVGGPGQGHLGAAGSWVASGYSVGVWRGYETVGIWQSQEEIDNNASLPSAMPGSVRYRDVNGDGEISPSGDFTVIGDPNPDFTWGFNTSLNYGQFDFSVFLRGVHGNEIRNLQQSEGGDGVQKINQIDGILENSWTPDNPDASRPKIDADRDFIALRNSDFFIEDGSYIRLQNVSLGYTLPGGLSPAFLDRARVYVSAQNVLTFTDYSGFDPEVSDSGQSNFSRGDDYDSYPRSRTFTTGINLAF
jgi:TonB-linked SusC/RagA family outer membrane protein